MNLEKLVKEETKTRSRGLKLRVSGQNEDIVPSFFSSFPCKGNRKEDWGWILTGPLVPSHFKADQIALCQP